MKECTDAASRFMNRFNVVKLLGECGAYKEKGVRMYYQIKMDAFHEGFSKNTVYRFLENIHMNWHIFLLRLSSVIIRYLAGLTENTGNRYALLVDDTPLPKCSRAMELISKPNSTMSITAG